jgi:hypothetical protein
VEKEHLEQSRPYKKSTLFRVCAEANMRCRQGKGFGLSQGDRLAQNLEIFTAYPPQVVTFFPRALPDKENHNSYGKFYIHI